ncbi:MAG: hypothetical protein ABWY56_17560 [Propionibacteriaceae bacterium]
MAQNVINAPTGAVQGGAVEMKSEIWILGATGRSGREVAARLDAARVPLVLLGRSPERLAALSAALGDRHRIVVGSLASNLAALADDPPGVVVNTVGPFATTGLQVARACPPGTHYVDIANEFGAVDDILRLDRQAAAAGQVLVTGAGFGVLATESVVLRLCEHRPRPSHLRVDALASVALEEGAVGAALAGSIVEVLEFGGREVQQGRLVRSANASHPMHLVTPDGDALFTASGANGELLAAWRASDADTVIAASTTVPANLFVRRVGVPVLSGLVRIPGVSRLLSRQIARFTFRTAPMARQFSWAHARAEWPDGTSGEGWLRVGDGSTFTADVMAEVAHRLLQGEGRPGAHTPGALFGPELVEALGGRFSITESRPAGDEVR